METAQEQWSQRPEDSRFTDLDAIYDYTYDRAQRSQVQVIPNKHLTTHGEIGPNGERVLQLFPNGNRYEWGGLTPTHWSLGQLCSRAEVPANWVRKTHPEIASLALDYGLTFGDQTSDQSMIMVVQGEHGNSLHCMTSPSYGRVYDYEVADITRRVVDRSGNDWVAPWVTRGPGRMGTMHYASDRNLNIFLTDRQHPISVYDPKRQHNRDMFRGVMITNSEVGNASFSIKTFLYDSYCSNRMIFGMSHQRTMRIRHTSGAPNRFLNEGVPMLKMYAEASPQLEENLIAKSMQIEVGKDEDSIRDWFKKRAFTVQQANAVIRRAREDTGDIPTRLWDVVQTGTAMARNIGHTDSRVKQEEKFSKLLKYAEA